MDLVNCVMDEVRDYLVLRRAKRRRLMDIFEIFYQNANKENAEPMSLYMRSLFPFLGLKSQKGRPVKGLLRSRKDDTEVDWEFISKCYEKEEREFNTWE